MGSSMLGHVVLLCDYILLAILFTMALCCTVAVLASSCNRTDRRRKRRKQERVTGYGRTQLRKSDSTDSYVNSEGNTLVISQHSGVSKV